MNWYFIRHGQIASNLKKVYSGRSQEPLTEVGQQQVKQASSELASIDIDAIYSSPLARTRQTAEIIVRELNLDLPVNSDESFNELRMGPWEGLAETTVASQYPAEWALWNELPAELTMEGRETLQQLQDRVTNGISAIRESSNHRSVLVVTHVAIIRVLTLLTANMNLNQYKKVPVENARLVKFVNL
jgi:broad specificity phosphatase PhoE